MTISCSEAPVGLSSSGSSPPRRVFTDLREAAQDGLEWHGARDLLALLIGAHGSRDPLALADALLEQHGLITLASLEPRELRNLGLSPTVAVSIAAACELSRRIIRTNRARRPAVRTPHDAASLLGDLAVLPHEELWILPLDAGSRLIGKARQVSRGGTDSCDADPRAVLRIALAAGATSILIAHNHPSADISASSADIAVTKLLVAAGRAIQLPVVDHIIVCPGGAYTSIRNQHPPAFQ